MPDRVLTVGPMVVVRYLSVKEVAEYTGLSVNTIKAYSKAPGKMPQPDALTGQIQGWLPETIDRWMARREQSN